MLIFLPFLTSFILADVVSEIDFVLDLRNSTSWGK
jgi:hypothetical protein